MVAQAKVRRVGIEKNAQVLETDRNTGSWVSA